MHPDRKKKLKKIEQKEARREARKRALREGRLACLARTLKLLGIAPVFAKLSDPVRGVFVDGLDPEVEVEVAADSRGVPEAEAAARAVRTYVKTPQRGEIRGRAYELAFEDVVRAYGRVLEGVEEFRLFPPVIDAPTVRKLWGMMAEAHTILDGRDRSWENSVLYRVCSGLHDAVNGNFFLDGAAVELKDHRTGRHPAGAPTVITVGVRPPEPRVVKYKGSQWTAYPCRRMVALRGLQTCRWNCRKLGIEGPDGELPVYVTTHALDRLHERLPFTGGGNESKLQRRAVQSLEFPVVVPRGVQDNLVEVRLGRYKLGYFVAHTLPHMILIRTFLFLTMQGTPESEKLRTKLGLHRGDVERYRLDDLATLADSDLVKDELLVRVLSECDCGHLLTAFESDERLAWVDTYGAEMKARLDLRAAREGFKVGTKYVRWGDPSPAAAGAGAGAASATRPGDRESGT